MSACPGLFSVSSLSCVTDCVGVVWAGACEQALLLLLAQGRWESLVCLLAKSVARSRLGKANSHKLLGWGVVLPWPASVLNEPPYLSCSPRQMGSLQD